MQKNDDRAIGRAGFDISDIQKAGVDLLQRPEGGVGLRGAGLRRSGADQAELGGSDGSARGAKEKAAGMIDCASDTP